MTGAKEGAPEAAGLDPVVPEVVAPQASRLGGAELPTEVLRNGKEQVEEEPQPRGEVGKLKELRDPVQAREPEPVLARHGTGQDVGGGIRGSAGRKTRNRLSPERGHGCHRPRALFPDPPAP